ncbi:hypothetical protein OL330_000852 [Vibrio parahaemolyticus]|nr:hypothetical protein [Vibrio parahaemolyticus]ELA9375727.1 hypothetical protein [Vibrio parahaemolyticus]
MKTLLAIVDDIYRATVNRADKYALERLKEFLKDEELIDIQAMDFNDKKFTQFISYISTRRSKKQTYNSTTACRRLLNDYNTDHNVFKSSPIHWNVAPKPTPKHFEPLSQERLDTLRNKVKLSIQESYKKEQIVQNAIKKGKASTKTGKDFRNPKKKETHHKPPFNKWTLSLNEALATLYSYYPDYPFRADLRSSYDPPKGIDYDEMKNSLVTMLKRMSVQKIRTYCSFIKGEEDYISSAELLSYLYPDELEVTIIKIGISLETGWTKDIIERIDADDYLYDPIPMDGDWAFVMANKVKGANSKQSPFSEQRTMLQPSNMTDPYSAYSLINLLKSRTARLRTGEMYEDYKKTIGNTPLSVHFNQVSRNVTVAHPALRDRKNKSTVNAARQTLKKKLIKTIGFDVDFRVLRPTKLYIDEKEKNLPLALQVTLFGHSISSITDGYKETPPFTQIRKDKLAAELNEIEKSISDGSFKGSLIPLKENKSIQNRIINIFTNHSGESPLATCTDPYHPDWKPELKGIRQDKPCKTFNKCLLCSQSSVFCDNIPFIVDRKIYLDQKKGSMVEEQFYKHYEDEYDAISEILDAYPYKEEILEAELRCAKEGFLLPPIISELGVWDY